MKRFLGTLLLVLIGVGAVVFVFHGMLTSMAQKERTASETQLRQTLVKVLGNPVEEEEAPEPDKVWDEVSNAPSDDTGERWQQVLVKICQLNASNQHQEEGAKRKRSLLGRVFMLVDKRMGGLMGYPFDESDQAILEETLNQHRALLEEVIILTETHPLTALADLLCEKCCQDCPQMHFGHLYECGELLGGDAILRVMREEYEEALREVVAITKLDNLMRSSWECIFVSCPLEGTALVWATNEVLRTAFREGKLPWKSCRPLVTELSKGLDRDEYVAYVANEASQYMRWLEYLPHNTMKDGLLDNVMGEVYSVVGRFIIDQDAALYANAMQRVVELASYPYYAVAAELAATRTQPAGWRPGHKHFLWAFEYHIRYTLGELAWREARRDMAHIALALEEHREAQGQYPESLDTIAGLLETGLPEDPFSGDPYRYRLTEGDYHLYSFGPNLIDDGGAYAPHVSAGVINDSIFTRIEEERGQPVDGDIVWCGRLDSERGKED